MQQTNREVDVVVDLAPEPLIIQASKAHLTRAIGNLVRNAVEALAGEGRVVVKTFGTCLVEPLAGYETVDPGDYAVVTVSDNGSGIPPQQLERLFKPFSSTRRLADSSGSGLGLAIVHG